MNAAEAKKDEEARALFRPGLYQHYKGDTYAAYGLTRHHDSGRSYVLYGSLGTGSLRVRPLVRLESHSEDVDCWMDAMKLPMKHVPESLTQSTPRFRYLGPLP